MKPLFFLIAICLFCYSNSYAQSFNAKYFESTMWASAARDSIFFKADTIKLVKVIEDTYFINGKAMAVEDYFHNYNYFVLKLLKKNKLKFSEFLIEEWLISTSPEANKWEYNIRTKSLDLFKNGKLFASFIPIPKSQVIVEIKSSYNGDPKLKTVEISLVKRKT